jgi:hypothetical protein
MERVGVDVLAELTNRERSTSCGPLDPATSSAFRQLSTAERKEFICKAADLMADNGPDLQPAKH